MSSRYQLLQHSTMCGWEEIKMGMLEKLGKLIWLCDGIALCKSNNSLNDIFLDSYCHKESDMVVLSKSF